MRYRKPDPRAGLFILLLANIGMFLERTGRQGNALTGVIIVVFSICEYDKTDVALPPDRGIVS